MKLYSRSTHIYNPYMPAKVQRQFNAYREVLSANGAAVPTGYLYAKNEPQSKPHPI